MSELHHPHRVKHLDDTTSFPRGLMEQCCRCERKAIRRQEARIPEGCGPFVPHDDVEIVALASPLDVPDCQPKLRNKYGVLIEADRIEATHKAEAPQQETGTANGHKATVRSSPTRQRAVV